MKINYKANFEISSEEIKDILFGLAKGFVKVQQWKAELDKSSSSSSVSESIRRKYRINRRHEQRMEAFHKKMGTFNNKKDSDIDVSTLPDDIKRQIALDYLKNHPLSEDKQKRIADEYIRKYGVIK